jgi:hypothetical protein
MRTDVASPSELFFECTAVPTKTDRGRLQPPPTHSKNEALAYFLTSPGAGVGFGAPELSFSAGILCEPAAPVVDGDGFAFVPPVVPLGFRSTAPLLPPACSSICLVVPWALAAANPAISAAAATMVVMVFILQYLFGFENLAASRDIFPRNVALLGNEGAVMTTALLNALFRAMTKDEVRKVSNFDQTAAFESWSTNFRPKNPLDSARQVSLKASRQLTRQRGRPFYPVPGLRWLDRLSRSRPSVRARRALCRIRRRISRNDRPATGGV